MSPALAGGFLTTAPPGKPCIVILDNITQGTNKALSLWAVTISNRVWVIKTNFWMVFFLILSWPCPKSHQELPRGNVQNASHISGTIISILLLAHKGPHLSFPPRVLQQLSAGAHPAGPEAGQPIETSTRYTNQTICHLGP